MAKKNQAKPARAATRYPDLKLTDDGDRAYKMATLAKDMRREPRELSRALQSIDPDIRFGNARYFQLWRVIEALFRPASPGAPDDDQASALILDPIAERARKDKETADKTALENMRTVELVYDAEIIDAFHASLGNELKTRLESLANRLAPRLAGQTAARIEEILAGEIADALQAIYELDPGEIDPASALDDPCLSRFSTTGAAVKH